MKKTILLIGALCTLLLAVLWYLQIVSEPMVSIGAAILTVVSYILVPDGKQKNKTVVKQHGGRGDNVAGKKTINNINQNRIEIKENENTTVQLANSVVNNYTIVEQERTREKGNNSISKFSAIEIKRTLDESPVFQREEIAKHYSGIRIQWKVTLTAIHKRSGSVVNLMTRYEGNYPWVYFDLDLNDHPTLKLASEGKELIVTGLILSCKGNDFYVDLEELEEV